MQKSMLIPVMSLILLIGYSCKNGTNIGDNYSAENHPVKELFLSSIGAFNQGKVELFLANFASDIKMYGTDGNYFGQDLLKNRFEILFTQFPNMKMEIPKLTLKILSREVVMVNFEWKVYPMGQGPAFSGIGSGIYQKLDGKWLEILEVETITHVDEALKQ
ncbi:MAG: nuclear transport factor 2 family protein [Flavobacteriaceae bacterium]|nr:nuclear transport factor 2 family protein [Flavobacteriaceae bacterium]